jgi:hypothetical protein
LKSTREWEEFKNSGKRSKDISSNSDKTKCKDNKTGMPSLAGLAINDCVEGCEWFPGLIAPLPDPPREKYQQDLF